MMVEVNQDTLQEEVLDAYVQETFKMAVRNGDGSGNFQFEINGEKVPFPGIGLSGDYNGAGGLIKYKGRGDWRSNGAEMERRHDVVAILTSHKSDELTEKGKHAGRARTTLDVCNEARRQMGQPVTMTWNMGS